MRDFFNAYQEACKADGQAIEIKIITSHIRSKISQNLWEYLPKISEMNGSLKCVFLYAQSNDETKSATEQYISNFGVQNYLQNIRFCQSKDAKLLLEQVNFGTYAFWTGAQLVSALPSTFENGVLTNLRDDSSLQTLSLYSFDTIWNFANGIDIPVHENDKRIQKAV